MMNHIDPEQDNRRNVYVIDGQNVAMRNAMHEFLSALNLQYITKDTAVDQVRGSPFSDEVLDTTLDSAQAIIVIFTAAEYARLRRKLRKSGEGKKEVPQPGMDQVFEAGYVIGRFPERTILIQIGQVQLFSDIDGRYIPNFSGTEEERKDLINRLRQIGCALQIDENRWRSAGNFQLPPLPPSDQ